MRRTWMFVVLLGCATEDDGEQQQEQQTEDAVDDAQEARSEICEGIVGMEALAWDVYAGRAVVDPVLPPPAPLGGVFGHPDLPLLGFSYPNGWTPDTLRGQGTVGVNLLRDDGQALYRYVSTVATGPLAAADVVDAEIVSTRNILGLDGQGTVVCRFANRGEVTQGTGIVGDQVNVLVRIEDQSMIVMASVITVTPDLPPSVFVRKIFAPTNEWNARLYDTFLAIDWQLLFGGGRNENDRDGDGVWDVFDKFPDDPLRN